MTGVLVGADGNLRCDWAGHDPLYQAYHDQEWGTPVADENRLYEKICLEGFQSGLSWLTILRKRDNFRRAFQHFDFHRVARFGSREVKRLMKDASIVRHQGKIESTINNARRAVALEKEFGSLATYFRPWTSARELAADLKRRGWTFVGDTTIYSFMQATGMVNDHAAGCFIRSPERSLQKLLASIHPKLNRGIYVFARGASQRSLATFLETEGVTSIVTKSQAVREGLPWTYESAWIKLTVNSNLDAVGFLAAITPSLAARGISCNVVSAIHHDHLFVPYEKRHEAMKVLRELQNAAHEQSRRSNLRSAVAHS